MNPGQPAISNRAKKIVSVAAALAFAFLAAGEGWAKDYRARKKKDGWTIDMSINRNPPVLGDNRIVVRIQDQGGAPLAGAKVLVNYYMPPMPGMAPMNYTIPAEPDGDEYQAVMDLIMTGPWNIVIKTKAGGKLLSVSFPIDVH